MLLLTFRGGSSLYALDARQVVEVVPRVGLRPIPHAPNYLVGLLSYRGQVVPVVDFNLLNGAAPPGDALSTRVVLTEFKLDATGTKRRLGLVAESVDQVLRCDDGSLVLSEMDLPEAPYLGRVFQFDQGLVQIVKPGRILSDRLQEALYEGRGGAG